MKKFISTCLALSLALPGVTGNAAFAAETGSEEASAAVNVSSSDQSVSSSTDVQSSVYELPVISPLPSSTTVSDIVYKLEDFHISNANAIVYQNGEVYIKQGSLGLSKVSLVTGQTTTILSDQQYNIRNIAIDSQQNLYYTINWDPYIKKVSLRSLQQFPVTYEQLSAASTNYAKYSPSSSGVTIKSMAFDSKDQLYVSISGYNSDNLSGIMKWNSDSQSFQSVILNKNDSIKQIAFDSRDNLYLDTNSYSTNNGSAIQAGIKKIESSSLGSLPITDKMMKSYKLDPRADQYIEGMVFLPDGTSYFTDGGKIHRIYTNGLPLLTLNGESSVTISHGGTYQEAAAYAEDEKYGDLKAQITYSLNGKPVEEIDTHIAGTYTVYYNVTTPDQRSAREVTRTVIVKEKPVSLTEVDFTNPVSMDYANDAVYVANPATTKDQEGGIYKVSLKDYSRKLIAELPDVQGVAVNKTGDLYFSVAGENGRFFKLDSHYLNEEKPLTRSAVMATAQPTEPFSAEQSAKGSIQIMGLDFDGQGRLYIAANQPANTYNAHSLIARSTSNTLSSFQQFGEADDIIRKNMTNIQDIEISPGGNLYANFSGFNAYKPYKIPASVLQADQPVLTAEMVVEDYDFSSHEYGITFLPNGEGYVTNMDYSKAHIYKTSFYDGAPTSPGAEDAYRLENLNIPTPYGMTYYKDHAYVAQGKNGLSKVSLSTRTVTQLVYGSKSLDLRAVTVDSKGGVYYIVPNAKNPEYTYIKKVDAASLNQPLTADQLLAKSINYAYIPESRISGLAMDKNNQLYISLDKGWDLDPGILRWNSTSKTLTPVSEEASMITAITFDNRGNLYFKSHAPQSYYHYAAGIVKISAADLKGALPVSDEKLLSYKQDVLRNESYNGLLFLPDGTSYFSNSENLKRVYPESRPILTLEGYSDTVVQGDIYTDPGIRVIEDQQYSKFDVKTTYFFNGEFVPELDTNKIGIYTIHYVAVNPAGIASLEKTREVTIKPTPGQLTDWYITGINSMDADSQNLYLSNYAYKDNPNHGLYKISLQTMQKTRLAAIEDTSAVAVNSAGDLFFTRYDMDNMIFKIEAKHLQSGKTLTADQLMKLSRTYMPFSAKETGTSPHKINGLEFDKQGRLYAAVNVYGKTGVTSKIVRLTGNDWNKSTLITELPVSSDDMDFSPAGDLYISTLELYTTWKRDTYKVTAEQLNTLPIQNNDLLKIPYTQGDDGIVFLTDGTGYVSRTDDFEKRKQTILKLNY